ncbi:unnamed protein product, partial [Polarella glacialis]
MMRGACSAASHKLRWRLCCQGSTAFESQARHIAVAGTKDFDAPTEDIVSLNASLTAFVRASDWAQGLQVLANARKRNVVLSVVTYGAAVAACDRGRCWEQALALLEELLQPESVVKPNLVVWNSTISACSRARHWERALDLLASLRGDGEVASEKTQASEVEEGRVLRPDAISYNSTLRSFVGSGARGGLWQIGVQLFSEMLAQQVCPSLVTLSTLGSACEKGNAWTTSLALIAEARQHALAP